MKSFKIVFATFLISVFLIITFSVLKVEKRHEEMVLLVSEKKITEAAKNCYYEDSCQKEKVTLGELIQKGYLKEEVNPITKMYYSHESYVEKKENTYTFVEVLS